MCVYVCVCVCVCRFKITCETFMEDLVSTRLSKTPIQVYLELIKELTFIFLFCIITSFKCKG